MGIGNQLAGLKRTSHRLHTTPSVIGRWRSFASVCKGSQVILHSTAFLVFKGFYRNAQLEKAGKVIVCIRRQCQILVVLYLKLTYFLTKDADVCIFKQRELLLFKICLYYKGSKPNTLNV